MTAPRQPQPLGSSDRAEPGIPQKIIDLYDDYTHLTLDRRRFFDHLTRVAGGTAAAYALLPLLENNYAAAALVAPDDARVATETVSFPGAHRSQERRVGKECVSTCSSRWSPYHQKNKHQTKEKRNNNAIKTQPTK